MDSLLLAAITKEDEFRLWESIKDLDQSRSLPFSRRLEQSIHQVPTAIIFELCKETQTHFSFFEGLSHQLVLEARSVTTP